MEDPRGAPTSSPAGGGRPPRRGEGGDGDWWPDLPSPLGRPAPMNPRTWRIGAMVAIPALVAADGALGLAAYYASHSVAIGIGVFAVMFVISGLELALVGWAAQRKQLEESLRARRQNHG